MTQTVKAIYENGVLKPLKKIALPEHKRVTITIVDSEDVSSRLISKAAGKSRSYDFLKRRSENIYSLRDGKSV